jgi:hypothetical protein
MYPLVSTLSLIARFYLCYVTIEQLPIFANDTTNWVIGQIISIYTVFRLICYPIVGVISSRLEIRSATAKSILYFLLYIPLMGVYWVVLLLLTHVLGVLPLATN